MDKPTQQMTELQKPEAIRWIFACLFNWTLIGMSFCGVYYFQNIWSVIFSILIIGNRQHALALLGHEGAHFMLSPHKKWNDFLTGFFSFWPLGINLPGYRNFHFAHHQNVGTAKDPELKHKGMNYPEFDLPITRKRICFYFLKDILFFSAYELFQLINFVIPKKKIHLLIPNLFLTAIILPLIYYGYLWVVTIWFMANISSFWAFFRLRVYIEHVGTTATHRIKSNPILNFIFLPYGADTHWEHHAWPIMLWYNRVKIRELINEPPMKTIYELLNFLESQNATIAPTKQEYKRFNYFEYLINTKEKEI